MMLLDDGKVTEELKQKMKTLEADDIGQEAGI